MTHPASFLPTSPPNTVAPSSSQTDDTHATEDNQTTQSTSTSRVVDDYLIVPQDDPSRPAIYTSGDLYTFLATTKETNFGFNKKGRSSRAEGRRFAFCRGTRLLGTVVPRV